MKPSERIAQIASERYGRRDALRGGPQPTFSDTADPRAIVDYLDELHAENEALRALVADLVPKPPGYTISPNSILTKKA